MTDRREGNGVTEQFDELFGTDAYLDDIARGIDPSRGKDPLAALMLELHREVNAPIPAAPNLDELLPQVEQTPAVVSLAERRQRRRVSPLMSGLVGAAAATMMLAGAGGAIYNAQPHSPLWNAKVSMFGEHAAVIDLASALDEVDKRHTEGDVQGAMQVLEKARLLADAVNSKDRESTQKAIQELEARIVEVPTTVTQAVPTTATATSVQTSVSTTTSHEPADTQAPIVITDTQTVTVTVVQSTTVTEKPVTTATPTPVATSEPAPLSTSLPVKSQ